MLNFSAFLGFLILPLGLCMGQDGIAALVDASLSPYLIVSMGCRDDQPARAPVSNVSLLPEGH